MNELPKGKYILFSGTPKSEDDFDYFYESPTKKIKMYFKLVEHSDVDGEGS